MQDLLFAALGKFPERQLEIRSLAATNEAFRTMCEDLADALAALARLTALRSPRNEHHIQEYESLVQVLSAEIAATLDASSRDYSRYDPRG